MDDEFILTGPGAQLRPGVGARSRSLMFETSVPGVFAIGDAGAVRTAAWLRRSADSAAIFSVHSALRTVQPPHRVTTFSQTHKVLAGLIVPVVQPDGGKHHAGAVRRATADRFT